MAAGIATGFVRKLYRILDQESGAILSWDASGASFSIFDSDKLNELVLPRYFRGRLSAFRQQLVDHGFQQLECEDNESREAYAHPDFLRGCPGRLSNIVRVPKGKKRPKQQLDSSTPAASTSLRVTLTAVGGRKRAGPTAALPSPPKRLRADAGAPKNPLFSNDPDDGAFSIARLMEGGGLLPASSELPDPISYLDKLNSNGSAQPAAVARPPPPAVFSDDLVRSALYFLVSTSVTGTETTADGDKKATMTSTPAVENGKTQEATRSDLLASLLASSTSGIPQGNGWGAATGAATGASNPLFSDQSTGDEEDDENSIWNLLVASSVDRVKSAIGVVADPQEKLRIIIAERERLEQQRSKVGAPAPPPVAVAKPPTRASGGESVKPAATNPLFGGDKTANPLFAAGKTAKAGSVAGRTGAVPTEDDLWRLLMSSSIDVFRALEQQDV